jgi:hypothetical protein
MTEQRVTADGDVVWEVTDKVLGQFMLSSAPVQVIQGPIGSGKTVACCLKLWAIANAQKPSPVDRIRRTRFAICRTTYPELKSTTIRTWTDVLDQRIYGPVKYTQPPTQKIVWGDVNCEIDFLALDDPTDIQKLRSGEYTAFFFNELQFFIKELFDEAQSRAGRYPSIRDGGPTWHGVVADMNAPSPDHFIALMRGMVPWPESMTDEERAALAWPSSWDWFEQPPALIEIRDPSGRIAGYEPNPDAENRKWMLPDYWGNLTKGKSKAWIDSRLLNRVALVVDGSPVWPAFRQEVHVSREVLHAVPGHQIWMGADFGRSPACLFGQALNNRVSILAEMQGHNESAVTFAPKVKRFLETHYRGFQYCAFGDPKGQDRGQATDTTAFDVYRSHGINMQPAPIKMNAIEPRIAAVDYILGQLYDGRPRLQISPNCRTLIAAMSGGYCYERKQRSSEIKTEPSKNRFSHLADSLQYLCIAMGEGRQMIGLAPLNEVKPFQIYRGRKTMRRITA